MSDTLVVRGARLYDGRGLDAIDDAVLVAQDGRVMYAGPAAGARGFDALPDAVDAAGRTLIPALIDAHVHLCSNGSPDFAADAQSLSAQQARDRCAEAALRALEAGITTVRDLGGIGSATVEAARAQASGALKGARILTSVQVLTVPGGHAHFIGREIASVGEMVKAIQSLHEAGATVIKLVATGGVLTPGIGAQQSSFPPEQLHAAVEEAHRLGLRVAAHAIGAEGIAAAVDAGVDSIEHGCFLSDPVIGEMIGNPTWLVATLSAPERIASGGNEAPQYAVDKSLEVMTAQRASFRRALELGTRIASGTDAGTPYNLHGGLSHELKLMHESGMGLERILMSATRDAAQLLGLGDIGSLEADKIADFVLLDGDPRADVGAYARVALVVQNGRIVIDRR
ncbi:MAG: amidohydrolase family protein [Actinobacteria bacterium]|nr:MAG: amidohydrolase family protein [Actinomycetota bacterium]